MCIFLKIHVLIKQKPVAVNATFMRALLLSGRKKSVIFKCIDAVSIYYKIYWYSVMWKLRNAREILILHQVH